MLRMLRREREEGLGYGSCVETGECTVPCYVVWRVRELEYYWRNCSVFPDPIEVGRVVIRSRGDGQHRHRGYILHLAPRQVPPRHRTAAEKRDEITDMRPPRPPRGRAGCGGSLPPSVTNYDQWGRRALSVSVICKASMMCVISQRRPKRQSDSVPVTESSKIAEGILPSRLASQPAGEDEQNGNDRDHSESELRTTVAVLLLLHQLVLSCRGRHGRIARRSPMRVRQ